MSEIKVNKISPRTNCGTTTLGDSGDTFTIPSGVTITNNGTANGFGATGAVNWQTTVKTSGFTATAGEGYFVDTTSGAISVNLPAGTAGAVVGFKDYAGTFDTNAVTLVQNGSDKIGGSTVNGLLSTEGVAVTLVFVDSTKGWLVTDSGLQSEAPTAEYLAATGGTVTTVDTNFKVHTFTGPGTFCVSAVGNPAGSDKVSYMVVAGGAGSGGDSGGGGGAGGFREGKVTSDPYTASPLVSTGFQCGSGGIPVAVAAYPVTVGAGGSAGTAAAPSGSPTPGGDGSPSTFAGTTSITSTGGGGGGSRPSADGRPGGSGGGARAVSANAGSGNTPPVTPSQGNDGGGATPTPTANAAGGGGATAVGVYNSTPTASAGGPGGAGATTSINGSPTAFAGGGGGGGGGSPPANGGTGGAGGGANGAPGGASTPGNNGTANTGGGSGGGNDDANGGSGGSGIVIIRYKFQG